MGELCVWVGVKLEKKRREQELRRNQRRKRMMIPRPESQKTMVMYAVVR